MNDIIETTKRMQAFAFWIDLIRETNNREAIGTALETLETIFTGTKKSLRDLRYESLSDVTKKCKALGLL